MKREIKFRAWHKDEKLMCKATNINEEGAFLFGVKPGKEQVIIEFKIVIPADDKGRFCEYQKIELMQYTGLKDKNGKEIYEGDIVRFNEFYEGDYKQRGGVAVIVWDEEGHSVCQVDKEDGEEFYICSTWDLSKNYGGEIIGNIYENPELIKE